VASKLFAGSAKAWAIAATFDPKQLAGVGIWSTMFPPSDNHRMILDMRGKRGRRVITNPAARVFYRVIHEAWQRAQIIRFEEWVTVDLTIVWPDRRRRDPANLFKVTLDALVRAGAIVDDCRALARIHAVKIWPGVSTAAYGFNGLRVTEPGILIRIHPAPAELVP
jgi:Holliday junction resolvase RusA-like endonuclease